MISTAVETSLWATAKETLRNTVSPHDFENYFEGMDCLGREGDTVILQAASLLADVFVNQNYLDFLAKHLTNAAGRTLAVRVTLAPGAESAGRMAPVESAPRVRVPASEALPPPPAIKAANTFENFIVGPENELAYSAAAAVAADPGQLYNPLLIYGNTGLGKTHLMHAVAHSVMRRNPRARIVYVTCEAFTDEYIHAVRAPGDAEKYQKTNDFKRRYRDVDVLLIDDIQFLAGKTGTQEEFFNIFNHLQINHRQVILTSDRPVKEIKELSDRLVSRFQGGMTADVQAPGLETRMAIVERKAITRGVTLTREVIEFLAMRIVRNVRNLEGAITRVAGYAGLGGNRELSVARLEQLLQDILVDEGSTQITADQIMRKVAERYNLRMDDMTGKRRTANIAWPRQVAMFMSTRLTDLSLVAIGQAFGGRDHGTVIHARKTVEGRMEVDPKEKRAVESLLNQFGGVV
jgi:chromosomal replication initiator protein